MKTLPFATRLTGLAIFLFFQPVFSQSPSGGLPVIHINTNGQTIPDEPKIPATMTVNNADGSLYWTGNIGIEVRGNSSQMFPKKSWSVETRDANGEELEVSFFGMPKDADWVMYSPYSDKTMLRNNLMYHLSNSIGRWAARTAFAEVVLNGKYHGVYVFMDRVKRGKNRVNITKLGAADTTGDAVTGGYLLQIDRIDDGFDDWYSLLPPFTNAWQRVPYQFVYPKPENLVYQQRVYMKNWMRIFEANAGYLYKTDPEKGYPKYLDVPTFTDYFILNEIAKNVDAFRLSVFLYKERDSKSNGKLKAGPIWDFDIGLGNADYYNGWETHGLISSQFSEGDGFQPPFWFRMMHADPAFQNQVKTRWHEVKNQALHPDSVDQWLDGQVSLLGTAIDSNFTRWPILNEWVWPNPAVRGNYANELQALKTWYRDRWNWLNQNLPGTGVGVEQDPLVPTGLQVSEAWPNPFNGQTLITATPAGSWLDARVFDVLGRECLILQNGPVRTGQTITLRLNANGLASGPYLIRVSDGMSVQSRQVILIR